MDAPLTFTVTCVEAQGLTNVEGVSSWSGKQDPYARVAIGKQTYETRVHRSGGAVATWGDRFSFTVSRRNAEKERLIVVVNDKNVLSDSFIGGCAIPLSAFLHGKPVDSYYPLNRREGTFFAKTRDAGLVHLVVQCSPPVPGFSAPAPAAAAPAAAYAPAPAPASYAPPPAAGMSQADYRLAARGSSLLTAGMTGDSRAIAGLVASCRWACPTCTFENHVDLSACEMCGASQPHHAAPIAAAPVPVARYAPSAGAAMAPAGGYSLAPAAAPPPYYHPGGYPYAPQQQQQPPSMYAQQQQQPQPMYAPPGGAAYGAAPPGYYQPPPGYPRGPPVYQQQMPYAAPYPQQWR